MDTKDIIAISIISALWTHLFGWHIWHLIKNRDKKAVGNKCVKYARVAITSFTVMFAFIVILIVVVLVLTIYPQNDDAADDPMIFIWMGLMNILISIAAYFVSQKIFYTDTTVTVVGMFRKRKTYNIADITGFIDSHIDQGKITTLRDAKNATGKFVLYFDKKHVTAYAIMSGITEYKNTIYALRPDLIETDEENINEL